MKIIAYSYFDPLLDSTSEDINWGIEVDAVYQDINARQQFQQLLQDCQNPETVNYVLIRRLDELGKTLGEVCDRVSELEALGIELIIKGEKTEINLTPTPQKELVKLLGKLQRQQQSRNIRKGYARNRLKTLPPPGKAPYGYKRGKERYILDRIAAPVVKDFFDRFLIYGSLRGAVRYLAQKYGKKISVTTGRRWLTNPVYRGDLEYQNGEVISNTHVAIISREEAAQIDRLLRRNKRLPPRTASAPRSLAGLVFCRQCNSPMTVAKVTTYRKDKEYLYLRPINCSQQPKCKSFSYEEVLEKTISGICQDLPSAIAALQMPDMDRIKAGFQGAIATKQLILEQIPSLTGNGILDRETAELRSYNLRTEISQLQNQLSQLPPVNLLATAQAVSLPQFWFDLSESERRFYFREFIRKVDIIREDNTWKLQLNFIFDFYQKLMGKGI
jgi:DNA invertase Pin-like site-specific DNA recombinase